MSRAALHFGPDFGRPVRGHVRSPDGRDERRPRRDDLRRRRYGPGAAVAAGVDAGRLRDLRTSRAASTDFAATRGRRSRSSGTSSTSTRGASGATHGARAVTRVVRRTSRTRSTTRWRGRGPTSLFFNGTNLFLYPEGRAARLSRDASTVRTEPDWRVTTGMPRAWRGRGAARTFAAANYHDLVDMPFFVGALRRRQRAGRRASGCGSPPTRAAPCSGRRATHGVGRSFARSIAAAGARCSATRRGTRYTMMQIVDSTFGGAQRAGALRTRTSTSLAACRRQRLPAVALRARDLPRVEREAAAAGGYVPYRYDTPQPTPWLWVSEGITDYYADLSLGARRHHRPDRVLRADGGQDRRGDRAPARRARGRVAQHVDPAGRRHRYIYYPKGSLAGFMLDIHDPRRQRQQRSRSTT